MANNPSIPSLRPYQNEALAAISQGFREGRKRQVLCAATGAGKTVIALHMAKKAAERGKNVWFVADRRVLVKQTLDVFRAALDEVGLIMGNETHNQGASVCIASAQTIKARKMLDDRTKPDLVIVDEIHEQHQYVNESLVEHDLFAVGLSATPFDASLKDTWSEEVVNVRTTKRLCDDGFLMLPNVQVSETQVDTEGVKVNSGTGEWVASDMDKRVHKVIGNAVELWVAVCRAEWNKPVPSLIFTHSIASAEDTAGQFQKAGHHFGIIHSGLHDADNANTVRRFQAGEIDGIVNVNVLTKGFDAPDSTLLMDLQPVRKSLSKHIQKLGRIMRPHPNKPRPLYLDLSGNWDRHGFQTMIFWKEGHAWEEEEEKGNVPAKTCPKCGGKVPLATRICPLPTLPNLDPCGYDFPVPEASETEYVSVGKDDLRRMDIESLMDEDVDSLSYDELWTEIVKYASIRGRGNLAQALKIANGAWKGWTGRWLTSDQKASFSIKFGNVRPAIEIRLRAQYAEFRKRQR